MNREELDKLLDDIYNKKTFLKIKDNVDLKELAKFGFAYYEDKNFGNRWFYQS